MNVIASHVLSFLLAFILPVQGMCVLLAQLQGPLHTHEATNSDEIANRSVVDLWDQHAVDPAPHQHTELGKERHFHAQDEAGIVVDDADQHDSMAIESGLQKFGSSGLFVTLVFSRTSMLIPELSFAANAAPLLALSSRVLPRLERPPTLRLS